MVWKRDYPNALFSSAAIVSDETVTFLSSLGRIPSRDNLSTVLAGQWKWESRYGDELFALLNTTDLPAMKPLPKKTRGAKRSGLTEGGPQQQGAFTFQPIQTPETSGASTSRAESSSHPQKRTRTARTESDQVLAHEAGANYVPSIAHPPYTPNQFYSTVPPEAHDPRNWFPYTGIINPYFAPAAANPPTFQFHNTFANGNSPPE